MWCAWLLSLFFITLKNFRITIAPLIALASAPAFGATFAIQGPLSNYGAGFRSY
jgi:small conductance mechanosensitive channel